MFIAADYAALINWLKFGVCMNRSLFKMIITCYWW